MNPLGLFDFVLEGTTAEAKMAHAERLGFNAVEAMGPLVCQDLEGYRSACERHGVQVSCVTGVWLGNGVHPDAGKRREQIAVHERYIRAAAELGAPRYIFVDHIPAKDAPLPPDQLRALARESLLAVADVAADQGVTVFVEAINRKFGPAFDTVLATAAFLRELAHPAVQLMVDSYHMAANGEAIEADTAAVMPLSGHVHVSDYQAPPAEPERPYPGGGEVDFAAYLRPVVAAGYQGPIIFEGSTTGDRDDCLRRSRAFIVDILERLAGKDGQTS